MSYFTEFQALSQSRGDNLSEQNSFLLQQTFDTYWMQTPDKITDGTIDGTEVDFVIQHLKYGEQFNDEKLMLVLNDTVVDIGSLVVWDGKTWLVMNQENRAIKTHKAFKITLCNNSISWKDLAGNVFVEKCFVEEGLGIQDANNRVPLSVAGRKVTVQSNVNTATIYENQRFVFNKKRVFKVVDIDDFTRQDGLILLKMEKDEILSTDDLANNIAYNGETISTQTPTTGIFFTSPVENNSIFVYNSGITYDSIYTYADSVIVKPTVEIPKTLSETVEIYEYVDGVRTVETFTFRIDNVPVSAYTITGLTSNSITIKCNQYYYEGNLVAIKSDLTEYTTPIILKSLF